MVDAYTDFGMDGQKKFRVNGRDVPAAVIPPAPDMNGIQSARDASQFMRGNDSAAVPPPPDVSGFPSFPNASPPPDVSGLPATSRSLPSMPPNVSQKLPVFAALGARNPETGMSFSPLRNPYLSKGGKLLGFVMRMAEGGLAGRAASEEALAQSGGRVNGGVGMGFQAAQQLPFIRAAMMQNAQRGLLENQMLGAQAQLYPQLAMIGAQKNWSEIQKNLAEGQKATAEAGAIPTKQALEQAQTLAAQWKEEPATGLLRNLSTGETLSPSDGGMAILDPQSAAVLGKQPGDRVPLKLALQAKQFVDAGVKTVQANGRSLLVDSAGKTIKDLGTATPVVVNQLGFSQFGQKEGMKAASDQYNTAMGADERLDRMEQAYSKALHGDQQAMLSLLTDHIGMTLGLQKGARITKDILNEAQQSQPWLAALKARFDDRGYLSGATLGPDQMRQMLDLGYEARNRAWQTAFNTSQLYGVQEPPNARAVFSKRDASRRVYDNQQPSGFTVTDPRGVLHTFPTQAGADAFRQAAGIQ